MTFQVEYELRAQENSDIRDHLPRLYTEASIHDVKVIELGVRSGNSTAAFLYAAEQNDGWVWSVDVAQPHVPGQWFQGPWTLMIGSDLDLADQLPDDVDIVFIDTNHDYELTLAELTAYVGKLKPGGKFILHDSELEHPDASPPTDPPFPVAQAIRDFGQGDVEWVTGCNGLAVITVGA